MSGLTSCSPDLQMKPTRVVASGKVKAVMDAMMTMVKLDVAALERAYSEA